MLSARPTASGATRLQRVKVGKKVKCITPNFTYVNPYLQLVPVETTFSIPRCFQSGSA